MISKKLDNFFHDNLWMIDEREYRWFQDKNNKVVPTPVLNGKLSHSDYVKRCEEFLDKAEKALDKQDLHELATMFKTADIDLGSEDMNTRWQNYLTLSEVFQYPNGEYNADAFDKEIIQSRNPVDPELELTDKLDNCSGKEYTGHDAVYMIVGQVKIPSSSRAADTYYYSTLKNNWVKDVHEGTQYDSKSDAEEDLWDAENLFVDDYSGETRFGWKYQLAVSIVGRKPRKGDHKNLKMENIMNIYEQLNKINDTESLSEKYNVKNVKELKKLRESQTKRTKKIKLNESLSDTQEEAIDITKDYILDNYSWSDWDSNVEGSTLTFTIWFDDDWGGEDSSETIFTLDINKLVEYMNDEEALGNYIESGEDYTNYEARGQEFYERAEKELEKHFGCTNAYLEPSTQMGRGGTFLFADDMSFEGNFDYQTGEEYIREDNFDGFLQLCLDSFTPRTDESLKESSNGKQDVRHEAQRIHDELIKKGYTNEEIDSIIRILHTSSINNFEPARPKLKAAFPDLDI